jgi:glycosyltransferase involved in cell wall biosynthesis
MLVKQATQMLLGIPSLFMQLLAKRRKPSIILIYSMQTPFMIMARFTRKIFGIPIVLIIPDLPQYMAFQTTSKGFRHYLKLIDIRLQQKMLPGIDGAIILAEAIATDFLPKEMPVITIDSIRDFKEWSSLPPAPPPSQAKKSILYSGGLCEAYGVKRLLEAFLCIEDQKFELWLAGRGELESTIREAMLKDHRIRLFGQLPVSELRSLQAQASLLVSVKPSNDPFTKYSFPSKITEYMLSGRPAACTRTPGLSSEYFDYIYPLLDKNTEAMKTSILEIFNIPLEIRMDRATKGIAFLQTTRSPYARGKELLKFFTRILEAKS